MGNFGWKRRSQVQNKLSLFSYVFLMVRMVDHDFKTES